MSEITNELIADAGERMHTRSSEHVGTDVGTLTVHPNEAIADEGHCKLAAECARRWAAEQHHRVGFA